MKCKKCGAELEEGVLYCRECGTKVTNGEIRICTECGSTVAGDAIFCPECGTRLDGRDADESEREPATYDVNLYTEENDDSKYSGYIDAGSLKTVIKQAGKTKGNSSTKVKSALLLIAVLFLLMMFIPRILSDGSLGTDAKNASDAADSLVERVLIESREQSQGDTVIKKGTEYAFMSDDWTVYIATAISDSVIQIEKWSKPSKSDKAVKHESSIGTFKINDSENGFLWLDDEHTAFLFTIQDEDWNGEGYKLKKPTSVVFSINTSNSNENKGTNCTEKVACYSYENDKWDWYRAIPLSENLIKIEVWTRSSSDDEYLYGYDLRVIDPDNTDTDFEWLDDEHSSFTITMQDYLNTYEWKEPILVAFTLENPKYKYESVKDYLN